MMDTMKLWRSSNGTYWRGPDRDGKFWEDDDESLQFRSQSRAEVEKYWGPMTPIVAKPVRL